ncbi:hypothetical protein [Phaeobacter porticola]|uniref:hypothetical protein n=1 Tax=Phaeobacter porticola TaxID=1844006 RepID=UPI0012FFBA68|nr:hypothetical protein [Phaeobacter porticola]
MFQWDVQSEHGARFIRRRSDLAGMGSSDLVCDIEPKGRCQITSRLIHELAKTTPLTSTRNKHQFPDSGFVLVPHHRPLTLNPAPRHVKGWAMTPALQLVELQVDFHTGSFQTIRSNGRVRISRFKPLVSALGQDV